MPRVQFRYSIAVLLVLLVAIIPGLFVAARQLNQADSDDVRFGPLVWLLTACLFGLALLAGFFVDLS